MAGSASVFVPPGASAPAISNRKAERFMSSLHTFYKWQADGDLPDICREVVGSQLDSRAKEILRGEGWQTLNKVALENAKRLANQANDIKYLTNFIVASPPSTDRTRLEDATGELKESFRQKLTDALDVRKISGQIGERMISWIEKGPAAAEEPKPA